MSQTIMEYVPITSQLSQQSSAMFLMPTQLAITTSTKSNQNGTQELMDYMLEKQSSSQTFTDALKFFDQLKSQDLLEQSSSITNGNSNTFVDQISTPQILEQLLEMSTEQKKIQKLDQTRDINNNQQQRTDSQQSSIFSTFDSHVTKIQNYVDSQDSPNRRKFSQNSNQEYTMVKPYQTLVKIKTQVSEFTASNGKQIHLQNYLNNLDYEEYQQDDHNFEIQYSKLKRTSSISTIKSSSSKCDSSDYYCEQQLSDYDEHNESSIVMNLGRKVFPFPDKVENEDQSLDHSITLSYDIEDPTTNKHKGDYYKIKQNPNKKRISAHHIRHQWNNREEFLKDRKERNRLAAQRLRQRRRHEKEYQEMIRQERERENQKLKIRLEILDREIREYRIALQNCDKCELNYY